MEEIKIVVKMKKKLIIKMFCLENCGWRNEFVFFIFKSSGVYFDIN